MGTYIGSNPFTVMNHYISQQPDGSSQTVCSALGSLEMHWLQARHDNPEHGTVTASFVKNGTSTSTIHLSRRKTMANHQISSQKEATLTVSKMSYLFLTLVQDECLNKLISANCYVFALLPAHTLSWA